MIAQFGIRDANVGGMTTHSDQAEHESARPGILSVIKGAAKDFREDQCTTRAAALSYYTVFALPPMLILLIAIAGAVWSPETVQRALESQFASLVGPEGARTVRDMVSKSQEGSNSLVGTIAGIVGLLFGATGAFLSLQNALNAIWEVKPDPRQGGVRTFLAKRLLSLGMLMGIAFLLVVSLAVTAALSALGEAIGSGPVMQVLTFAGSLSVLAVLFAAIFRFLPDAVISWRDALVGGAATAVLFEVGKLLIGLYLGRNSPGTAFGAAAALAVILVWVYYAGMLVLFGAEFTQHYAEARGTGVRPRKGAVRFEEKERIVRATTP